MNAKLRHVSGGHSEAAKTVVMEKAEIKELIVLKAQPYLHLGRNDETTLNIECTFPMKLSGNMNTISMKIYSF